MNYLIENQNIPSILETYIKNTPALHSYFEIRFDGIRPKNYCGFLSINNESYFIIPKITDENTQNLNTFIYMLIYAYNINLKNEDLMSTDNQEHQIFELFIRLFSDALLDEFKKGVFKQYITMQENLKVLRGKYIIEKNFTNFYHQNIYCEFDEFSMDNELNRFFLYMNSRYKKSYEVALMILQKLVPMTQNSTDKSFAFLFDMAEVFEKFVGRMYGEIDASTQLQKQGNFGSLVLKPDIMTENKIIDTKYKKVKDRGDLSVQDKYQMFVYGVNFKVKDTMLLYPKHLVEVDDNLELGRGKDVIQLGMKSLDLNFDGKYDRFIEEIKKRLEGI
jgi:5-methylcytosine-specific restriction enzyme subunit McrC